MKKKIVKFGIGFDKDERIDETGFVLFKLILFTYPILVAEQFFLTAEDKTTGKVMFTFNVMGVNILGVYLRLMIINKTNRGVQ